MIDIDEFFLVHDDKTMNDELTFNINISSKFKQKRRRKSRNDKIVKKHLNYIRNIMTTFKIIFENF